MASPSKNSSWRMTSSNERDTTIKSASVGKRGLFPITSFWYVFVSAWCWRFRISESAQNESCQNGGSFLSTSSSSFLLLLFRCRLRLDWSSRETWSFLSLSLFCSWIQRQKSPPFFVAPKTEEKKPPIIENLVKTPLRKETKKTPLLTEAKQKRKEERNRLFDTATLLRILLLLLLLLMSASLPPIDTSKSDAHHGNQNELQSVGLQKFYDFFKSKATSIPFDSSSAEMPGTIGKSIDIRVGPNFELHPLLETAMPLEKPKLVE